MARTRKNFYFTDKQVDRLEKMSREENLPEAEIVRRALDAYLAWNDPTYQPTPPNPQKGNDFSSLDESQGLSSPTSCKNQFQS